MEQRRFAVTGTVPQMASAGLMELTEEEVVEVEVEEGVTMVVTRLVAGVAAAVEVVVVVMVLLAVGLELVLFVYPLRSLLLLLLYLCYFSMTACRYIFGIVTEPTLNIPPFFWVQAVTGLTVSFLFSAPFSLIFTYNCRS
jgi:hypothetical protein